MRIALPYLKRIASHDDFSSGRIDHVAHDLLARSTQLPCYLEVASDREQYFLFFRDKQIYAAGRRLGDSFTDITIKDFLFAIGQMSKASAAAYEVNSKILHSMLILFQKKPTLKLLTSMVDLDEVLDRIEEEGKSCIVSASQDNFLAALRYEKGEVTALCHEHSSTSPREKTFRDDFLVKIYTLSAETPLTIAIYEDLLVKYASDAKTIDEHAITDITELYMSKPPILTLEFKSRQVGQWTMDRPSMNIGRTADNDIVIDNLAVSRLHAVLEKDKGHYYIRDCDSLNGTQLNGQKIGRARLQPGDKIVIGKHCLRIQKQTGMDVPVAPAVAEPFDQTIIMTPGSALSRAALSAQADLEDSAPRTSLARLVEKTNGGQVVHELTQDTCVIGKDAAADIEIDGLFVAGEHAEIRYENGSFVIRHINGRRKVSVDGKAVKEKALKNRDSIKIGKRQFTFQE